MLAVWLATGCGEIREIQVAPADDTGTGTTADATTADVTTGGATSSSTASEDTESEGTESDDRDTEPNPEPTASGGTGSPGSSSGGPVLDRITECFDLEVTIPGASPQGVTIELTVDRTDVTIADLDVKIRVGHESAVALQLWLGRDGEEPVPLTLGDDECMKPFMGVFHFDDEAGHDLESWCFASHEPVMPETPLAMHDGSSSAGTWQVTVIDPVTQLGGMVSKVCFDFVPEG